MSLPEKIKKFNKESKITTSKSGREVLEVNSYYQTKQNSAEPRVYMDMKVTNSKTRSIAKKG